MSVNLNDNGTLKRIAGGTFYADAPVGTIQAYGGVIDVTHQAPSGWLLCDGSEKNIDDFADLYAVIGDAFGTPSVNTKFVLPDLREATTKGAGLTGKSSVHYDGDGVALGEFIDDRAKNLSSTSNNFGGARSAPTGSGGLVICDSNDATVALSKVGATTEVKAVGVNYIIKAKQTALPVDLEAEMIKLNSPDWSNAVNLDYATYASQFLAGTYAVPDDGWLVGHWLGSNSADRLTVNGVAVGASSYANSNWCGFGNVNVKVNKGDLIKVDSIFSSGFFTFAFVPHK